MYQFLIRIKKLEDKQLELLRKWQDAMIDHIWKEAFKVELPAFTYDPFVYFTQINP
jgi:hypothetical protein